MAPYTQKKQITSWDDIVGLNVSVTGNVNMNYSLSFAGIYGGADTVINDFEFWNFTYTMPADLVDMPNLLVEVTLP